MGLSRSEAVNVAELEMAAEPFFELDGTVVEASYGWVFYVRAVGEMMSGGYDHIVVEADTGRVIHGASGPDRWEGWSSDAQNRRAVLEAYEKGYRFDLYDLTIKAVNDIAVTVATLELFELTFVVPEDTGDVVWTIAECYTNADLETLLRSGPITFTSQGFGSKELLHLTEAFDQSGCCDYEVNGFLRSPGTNYLLSNGPIPPRADPAVAPTTAVAGPARLASDPLPASPLGGANTPAFVHAIGSVLKAAIDALRF